MDVINGIIDVLNVDLLICILVVVDLLGNGNGVGCEFFEVFCWNVGLVIEGVVVVV